MIDNSKNISKKQISINMVANIVSYSSQLIISFVLTPFLIKALGKDVYSFYPLAATIVSYLSILTGALNTMGSRFFTVELVKGDEKEANKYYSSVLASNVVLSVILIIPMAIFIIFIEFFLNVPINFATDIKILFSLVFLAALVNVIGSIYGIATFAKNRIDLRSLRELIISVVRLVLFVLLYKLLPASITYAGIITVIVALVNLSIQFFYTRRLLPGVRFNKNNVSIDHTKKLLASTSWNIVFTFGNVLLSSMTLVLVNILYSAEAAGSLSIVQTVPSFANGVILMLVGLFFPVITYKIAEKDMKGAVEQIANAQRIIAIVGCAMISVFSGLSTEFFTLWVPDENSAELFMLSFVTILPYLFISCTWILTNLNMAMNKVKKPAIFTICIGGLSVFISVIAVKLFNIPYIWVQAISSSLQIVLAGIYLPVYASREMKIPFGKFFLPVLRALIASIICFLMTVFLKSLFVINNWLAFIIIGGVIGIISLLVTSVIELGPSELKSLCKTVLNKKHIL